MDEQQIMEALNAGQLTPQQAYDALRAWFGSLGWPDERIPSLALDRVNQIHPTWNPVTALIGDDGEAGLTTPADPLAPGEEISDRLGRRASFLQRFGIGQGDTLTPADRFRTRFFDPLERSFDFEQQIAPILGEQPRLWEDFLPDQAFGANAQANLTLRRILGRDVSGLSPALREEGGLAFTGLPDRGEVSGIDELQGLMRAALQRRYGTRTASWLAGQLGEAQTRFQGRSAQALSAGRPQPLGFLQRFGERFNL